MSTLSDIELLRIAGLRAEQAIKALPALRQCLALLPTDPVHDKESPQWPLLATAVTFALGHSSAHVENGWLRRWHVIGVIAQIVGILRNRGEDRFEIEWTINRAVVRHWLDATGDPGEFEPQLIRPTLLGERTVRERLGNAVKAVDESPTSDSAVNRLKAFRTAFLMYMRHVDESQQEGVRSDPQIFAVMQDAWIDLADVVHPKDLYEVDAIETAVTRMWPDHARDVWAEAEREIGKLILSIGSESRLQRARAAAFRSDIDKLFPATEASTAEPAAEPAASAPPPQLQQPVIQYVSREQASALCQKSKDTLERWLNADANAPQPVVEGCGGKAHLYDWAKLRPWLETKSGMRLPEQLPAMR